MWVRNVHTMDSLGANQQLWTTWQSLPYIHQILHHTDLNFTDKLKMKTSFNFPVLQWIMNQIFSISQKSLQSNTKMLINFQELSSVLWWQFITIFCTVGMILKSPLWVYWITGIPLNQTQLTWDLSVISKNFWMKTRDSSSVPTKNKWFITLKTHISKGKISSYLSNKLFVVKPVTNIAPATNFLAPQEPKWLAIPRRSSPLK